MGDPVQDCFYVAGRYQDGRGSLFFREWKELLAGLGGIGLF